MGVEDREWFKEQRAERLKKAFRASEPNKARPARLKPVALDQKTLAGVALALSALLILASNSNLRTGFLNAGKAIVPPTIVDHHPRDLFPRHGTVKRHVPNDYLARHELLVLQGPTDGSLTVVRIRTASGDPVLTAYLAGRDVVELPMPPGAYQLTVAYGRDWLDDERLFGLQTAVVEIANGIFVNPGVSQRIDLQRRPDGNLPMKETRRASF